MRSLVPVLLATLLIGGSGCEKIKDTFATHWDYEHLDKWGGACPAGKVQSPIDIQKTVRASLDEIRFDYNESSLKVTNNGHTIQVNVAPGNAIAIGDNRFELLQFHFHTRSEHTIRGISADMEVHFVHKDSAGNLGVVGVMMKKGDSSNALLANILSQAPKSKGDGPGFSGNPAQLLPENKSYYTYTGSLTTPECSEGLKWMVLKSPITISESQFGQFKGLFSNNARPVQPLNNRIVLESGE